MNFEQRTALSEYSLLGAWLIALAATLVALYSGEILKMPVCLLCWYQRIFMFPLAIQLGIACFRHDLSIAIYTLPLAALGAIIALYHYLIQMFPSLAAIIPCSADASGVRCDTFDWQILGFITFPLLSFIAFLIILILSIITIFPLPPGRGRG